MLNDLSLAFTNPESALLFLQNRGSLESALDMDLDFRIMLGQHLLCMCPLNGILAGRSFGCKGAAAEKGTAQNKGQGQNVTSNGQNPNPGTDSSENV